MSALRLPAADSLGIFAAISKTLRLLTQVLLLHKQAEWLFNRFYDFEQARPNPSGCFCG